MDPDNGRLTPETVDLFKKAFRGVHLLAYLKREEVEELDRAEDFERAAEDARSVQDETFGLDDEAADNCVSDAAARRSSPPSRCPERAKTGGVAPGLISSFSLPCPTQYTAVGLPGQTS